ncbi:hypothetical protein [Vibrio owensii]|uniref:hypothetical protein n=1 Tax=Vibrio owensii TaxID=696485 RepID=UPI0018F1EEAC|nr:hypothetical protein [Vibrio owensii]
MNITRVFLILSIFLLSGCGGFDLEGEWQVNVGSLDYYEPYGNHPIKIDSDYFDNGKVKSKYTYEVKEFPKGKYVTVKFDSGFSEKYAVVDEDTMVLGSLDGRYILTRM